MGHRFEAICSKCGEKFTVYQGGGFSFYLLHCNKCGEKKSIGFDELQEIHLRYIKGLLGPWCNASGNADKKIQEWYPGEPLGEKEYRKLVEEYGGKCACGGIFSFSGKSRCPKCHSKKIFGRSYGY